MHFPDWELDRDREGAGECNELEDGKGAVGPSDCASCASRQSLTSDDRLSEFAKVRMDRFRNSYSFITYVHQGLLVFLPPFLLRDHPFHSQSFLLSSTPWSLTHMLVLCFSTWGNMELSPP